jgi:hypothetical protein
MKNLFKQVTEAIDPRTNEEIIAEIHETFNTEVERLLDGTKVKASLHTDKEILLAKSRRLDNLGFINTTDTLEGRKEADRINQLRFANEEKDLLNETILYFQDKYPLYKFITEESVKRICEKYGLVYGQIAYYEGFVPEKNLSEIENFKVEESDKAFHTVDRHYSNYGDDSVTIKYYNKKTYDWSYEQDRARAYSTINKVDYEGEAPFEIAAPVKDFNTDDMILSGSKLSIKITPPDPIVLQPVMFENKKHYLIVTAWGEEASDPLVVNEKMN